MADSASTRITLDTRLHYHFSPTFVVVFLGVFPFYELFAVDTGETVAVGHSYPSVIVSEVSLAKCMKYEGFAVDTIVHLPPF